MGHTVTVASIISWEQGIALHMIIYRPPGKPGPRDGCFLAHTCHAIYVVFATLECDERGRL